MRTAGDVLGSRALRRERPRRQLSAFVRRQGASVPVALATHEVPEPRPLSRWALVPIVHPPPLAPPIAEVAR